MIGAIEAVLAALNAADVRYMIVGGVAVVLHGYLRTTADLDLIVELEPDNVRRAVRALEELGYQPRVPLDIEQLADSEARQAWVRDKGLAMLALWSERVPALEVDLFVDEPLAFDGAYARAVTVELDTTRATVIALDDLIALKRRTNRPKDKTDIEALRQLASKPTP